MYGLIISTIIIAFFHTLLGPDHYLPFVMMAKAGKWSSKKTMWMTFFCGLGHMLSAVLIGMGAVAFGLAMTKIAVIESLRGNVAAWMLMAFGLVYCIWGLRKASKKKYIDVLSSGIIFIIFVLGPCESLIPLLMYPAIQGNISQIILVAGIFSGVTILTMMGMVMALSFGMNFLPWKKMERYSHALAGFVIFCSGAAIQFLGM